ncbi:MAG: tripartite tricarboxylate transporter substrate binding protein [Betaproteobacteria bacterium]|jgi:tripartite-type tricarboxylate transporter receptor subunit TctC|nr:tripartite tricarboxylate transporter substrate binding protein [Betaproteobacteria bacterium]MBP6646818.1 tripartite tricarboxylate transporter substrate binding protein [Burkholderiaceae bacterium]
MSLRRRQILTALATACALANPALAQTSPIKLVVPYAPGGPIDVTARLLAQAVKDTLGIVVIENKPGAGGNIGADAVAKAPADGLTIGIAATATHAINPWLFSKMPYNALTDFAPITQILRVPNVLVMNADTAKRLKIASVKDLVAYAKVNPGKLNYGSGGNGSAGHLAGEMFKAQAGIFAVHIPYNGGNPAQLALLSGQVDFNIDNLATAAPNIKSGKLLALAVTSAQRSPALPEAPTMAETLKGFEVDTWWGLVAPAGTPAAIIDKLNAAFVTALKLPDTRTRFAGLMAEPVANSPKEFADFIKAQYSRYEGAVKASGAKVD